MHGSLVCKRAKKGIYTNAHDDGEHVSLPDIFIENVDIDIARKDDDNNHPIQETQFNGSHKTDRIDFLWKHFNLCMCVETKNDIPKQYVRTTNCTCA